jgi:hypothetical protein
MEPITVVSGRDDGEVKVLHEESKNPLPAFWYICLALSSLSVLWHALMQQGRCFLKRPTNVLNLEVVRLHLFYCSNLAPFSSIALLPRGKQPKLQSNRKEKKMGQ